MYNFDEIIDRKGTNALNTDGFRGYIFHSGPEKVFPYKDDEFVRMWVADMEFGVAPEILNELRKRIDRRIFGYTGVYTHDYYNSFSKWCKEHYDWSFPEEELCFTPGIIPALYQLTETLCNKDEKVLMNTPAYGYFLHSAEYAGVDVLQSPLKKKPDGTFELDYENFEQQCANPQCKMVFWCNPQNPTGRMWTEEELRRIRESACVHVHPYGAISVGQKGEQLADLDAMVPEVIAFSDDGKGVQSESLMREAMEQCRRLGKILAAHCEDNRLLRGGYIHDGAYAKTHSHRGICSESEWGQIARDVRLAEETGCAYHVCHVSTKESVSIIREAKRRGVNVTCETGPHYLTFTEDDLQEDGRFKMNPPLRSREDRDALIEGLLDGTIDMIVTDHAPHSREEKARGLEKSAMGVVGLETSFAACYTSFVKPGVLPLGKLVDLMHDAPMRRFGCGTELAIGQPADLTVFNLSESYVVEPEQFLSMGRATPFAGVTLTGVCKMTMIDGKIVWKEETL